MDTNNLSCGFGVGVGASVGEALAVGVGTDVGVGDCAGADDSTVTNESCVKCSMENDIRGSLSSFQNLPDMLKTHGSIYWLAIGGGKNLYIGAYLKSIDELELLVNFVKKGAGISEPTVGIMSSPAGMFPGEPKPSELALYDLDYAIIRSLKDNSRKAVSDIADELGIFVKTVRRRLSRLIKNGLIELSLEWYPDASNDIITLFAVNLKPDADMSKAQGIPRKYFPNICFGGRS